ncbi:MAG: DUF748 domain-containing protein, partial [Planctomycetes bacterium]|nr:DUF748 domain-containing protein [Planctomycetota bacterium]
DHMMLNGAIEGLGDVTYSHGRFSIFGDNTYNGHTYITVGQVFTKTLTALGSSAEGTTIQGGFLTVQAPTNERFRIEGGQLRFDDADFDPSVPVTIAGGSVVFPRRDTYTTPIIVDLPGGILRFGFNASASWTGGSTGTGSLQIDGRINVDAPLTHNGDLIIKDGTLNVANTYTGDTTVLGYVIKRGELRVNTSAPAACSLVREK